MSTPKRRVRPSYIDARVVAERNAAEVEQMVSRVPEVLDRNGIVRERRDPSAATRSLRWVNQNYASAPDWDAARAFEMAYYMNVVVYACTRLAANTVSMLPFRVGADPDKPNDYDPNAPLAKLLGPPPGGPAPKLSARRLWAWTVAQRHITGRNAWEIETPPGEDRPVALWPLASSSLKAIPTESGTEWFKSFEYGRVDDPRKLRVDQVAYDWDPSGTDFRQPESALQAANLDISVAIMQSRYDYGFLKNDARPAAIVVTEEFEDQDSFEAFKTQWNGVYGGPDNAGRMAFLETTGGEGGVSGAVDVKVLGFSPKDAQAAQRHTAAMERTAIALGTPWSLLDASGRTFDNASQEWRNYILHKIMPMLHDFQDMVNMQIAPRLDAGLVGWFDLTKLGITEMDRLDAQGVATLKEAGVITKNEGRAPFGLPAVPDGDGFEQPPSPVPATPIKVTVSASGEVRKMHAYEGDGEEGCDLCGKPAVHQAHGYFLPRSENAPVLPPARVERESGLDHEQRRAKIWTSTNGKVRNLERQWERALRKMFARQQRSAIARLEGKRGRSLTTRGEIRASADEVFDPDHWLSETADDVTALYEAVTAAGGARVSDLFGLAFDIEAPYAQEFVKARAKQLAGQVTDTTYQAIQDTLAEGIHTGEAIPELADRIRHVFDVASTSRATTIARTEVISAFNGSATLTATEYGSDVVGGQEWIATTDSRTREWHAERDGEIVAMGELFSGGLAYPGDPSADASEVVNCRCTVAFLTPEEMDANGGGRSREVERRIALSVLRMVRPGAEDVEAGIRAALKVAA